jgi:aminopeptidase N
VRWLLLAAAVSSLFWVSAASLADGETLTPIRHDIVAQLSPADGGLRVHDRFAIGRQDSIEFTLAPWLRVESARLDGEDVHVERAGNVWRIAAPGVETVDVELVLQGQIPDLSNIQANQSVPDAVSGPDGSYLPGYAAWIADTEDFRITYDLTVEVPLPYRAAATGRLVTEQTTQGLYRAVFAAELSTEPPSVFAGPYEVMERDADSLRLRTYFHRELSDLSDDYLTTAAAYLARYESQIGPYPHRDFYIISSPLPVGLGFSNVTYVGRQVLPLPFMRGRSLAHEILHSWWGNGVATDYKSGNWAEGLTTYMADYALAADRSEAAAREMRLGWLRDYAALPKQQDLPVTDFTAKTHDAAQVVGYGKVAFIFLMLRRELGDEVFAAALRSLWQQYRHKVAGWVELRIAFETAAGQDLAWFFDQWLKRPGAPEIELVNARQSSQEGNHQVIVTLRQAEPLYRMRLTVLVETSAGNERSEILLERAEQTFTVSLDDPALAVEIDPAFETFRKLLPRESPPILRDVTLSADAVTVVPTGDKQLVETARRLARRLLQREPELVKDLAEVTADTPVLFIAGDADLGLLPVAATSLHRSEIAHAGTARAWTFRDAENRPWLVVTARDAGALEALLRPLPHYRNRSYVVFEEAIAIRKGVWNVSDGPLSRRFDR